MPIEIIAPQREGLHIGLLPVGPLARTALRRLRRIRRPNAMTSVHIVANVDEACETCDLVFELHSGHWRLVSPNSASADAGIWHAPSDRMSIRRSALGAAHWVSEMLHRLPGSTLEFPDLLLWLRPGGRLQWWRVACEPRQAHAQILRLATSTVSPNTLEQLIDLAWPSHRGARRQFMNLQRELHTLMPERAGTWSLSQWCERELDQNARVRGFYLALQAEPCPSAPLFTVDPLLEIAE